MNPSSRDFTEAPKALSIYSSRLAALCILAFSALLITSIASAQTQMHSQFSSKSRVKCIGFQAQNSWATFWLRFEDTAERV